MAPSIADDSQGPSAGPALTTRDDGFTATAAYYHHRPPHAQAALDWIAHEYGLDGHGRLMDGGCGTGHVFLRLAHLFEEVVAVDPSAEMLAEAARLAGRRGLGNVCFVRAPCEDVVSELGPLRLASFGSAFHRTDRLLVAERLFDVLAPGGGLVCLETCGEKHRDWEQAVTRVLDRWRRNPGPPPITPGLHQEVLRRTRFQRVQVVDFRQPYTWTLESRIGALLSTSFASPAVLGPHRAAFEADLASALLACDPSGIYEDIVETTVISARKTAAPGCSVGGRAPTGKRS